MVIHPDGCGFESFKDKLVRHWNLRVYNKSRDAKCRKILKINKNNYMFDPDSRNQKFALVT